MRGVWTRRGGAAGNLSQTHAAKNKKRPWNVWPSPKSLPPPSARAPSLGEKQEAPILWNKFLLMWTCWWGLKGGRWTHMTIRMHFTAFYRWLCDGVLFLRPQMDRVSGQSQQSNPCCPCHMSDTPGQEKCHTALLLRFTLPLRFENKTPQVSVHKH